MARKTNIHTKLEVARKELLDLGLRNPLLNYRTLKARGLEIVQKKPSEVYRVLVSDKKKMTFAESENTEDTLFSAIEEEQFLSNESEEGKQRNFETKLQTNYSDKHLEKRLLNTYYYTRTYLEEQGVNILYMALGMLHWYESESSQEPRKAPLILIPVQLDRVSARERFTVTYTEDDIGHNISLQEKMKLDFGITIPDLPEDQELNIDQYLLNVAKSTEGQKRWFVDIESIVVGFFSFGKFLMYRDLDLTKWPDHLHPEEHPLIKALLEDGFKEEPSQIEENDSIDQHFQLTEANHVLDADSSQIKAILDANQGRNMVIQGPPGTGKSQTITNLIAEAIGAGKKILFVSEKMAALEVVKRRLDSVGLGVACLELHSHKTNKKSLLNELSATLELGKPQNIDSPEMTVLEEFRSRLNEYCETVHTEVGDTGISPYRALGELTLYQNKYKDLSFPKVSLESMDTWTAEEYKGKEVLIEELQNVIKSLGPPAKHPFWGSKMKGVMPTDIDALEKLAQEAVDRTKKLEEMSQKYATEMTYPSINNTIDLKMFIKVLRKALDAPELEDLNIKSKKWLTEEKALSQLIEMGMKYTQIHKKYESILLPEAWEQDLLATKCNRNKYWK